MEVESAIVCCDVEEVASEDGVAYGDVLPWYQVARFLLGPALFAMIRRWKGLAGRRRFFDEVLPVPYERCCYLTGRVPPVCLRRSFLVRSYRRGHDGCLRCESPWVAMIMADESWIEGDNGVSQLGQLLVQSCHVSDVLSSAFKDGRSCLPGWR